MKPNDQIIYLTLAGISISLISAGDREIQKSGSRLCDHVTPYGTLMSHYLWRFITWQCIVGRYSKRWYLWYNETLVLRNRRYELGQLGRALKKPRLGHWVLKKAIKWSSSTFRFLLWGTIKCLLNWMMALAPGSLPCEASSAQSPATLQPPKHPSLTLIPARPEWSPVWPLLSYRHHQDLRVGVTVRSLNKHDYGFRLKSLSTTWHILW